MVNVKAWNVQQRKAKGFSSMMMYMKRKPGRPKKKHAQKKQASLTNDDLNIPTVDVVTIRSSLDSNAFCVKMTSC